MTVWYRLSTLFNRHTALHFVVSLLMLVALISTILVSATASAVQNTNKTLSFQGRLMSSTGSVVADGYYNIQFKIYEGGTGTTAGNPGGALKWTESYINNGGTNGIQVKNGYFSANLGSLTPFGSSVDWNNDTLFLSMNVAGNSATCSTFGTAPCVADGEMLPMKRITATPYSLNSGAVGGKTADDLVQLGQGAQTDSSNNSSIHINKTGDGNLIQLQAGGKDSFTVNKTGSVTLGSATDQAITVAKAESGEGKDLSLAAGAAATGSDQAGGDLLLQGGAGDGSGDGGSVIVKAASGDSTGTFQVQDTSGASVLNVDTANKIVSVGTLKIAGGIDGATSNEVSLWEDKPITGTAYNDGQAINVGTTFRSDKAGQVTGVKFYNPYTNNATGTDIGKLWACNSPTCSIGENAGTELASVTFAADGAEGWKKAYFSTPVTILPDTYYVVTYYSQGGSYYAAPAYFESNSVNSVPLHAPSTSVVQNGNFSANTPDFPKSTFGGANYWVDVMFKPATTTDQISTEVDLVITSGGSMTVGPTNNALSLQGSAINVTATNGGNVTMQGGDATVSNGNGGSIHLSGGAGNGTGADGLVVIGTPTFGTSENDANCYASGAPVAASCGITQKSVDSTAAIKVGFTTSGQTATLPDPTIKTAGRIMYIMAASGSQEFTLATSGPTSILMAENTAATLIWNGSAWLSSSGTTTSNLLGSGFSPQSVSAPNTTSSAGSGEDLSLVAPETDTSAPAGTTPVAPVDDPTLPLLTVGKAASAPAVGDHDALLGSMYYDTTIGKLQCYEESGWGSCGASPDTFITLSPEYANAVTHGAGVGTMSSDLCSDTLNINNGNASQPTICGANETFNFYNWTSPEATSQTRSIFVTYQLPATFKGFVPDSTSLMSRTDSAKSNVTYQIYRNNRSASLVPCGASVDSSTGAQSTWKKAPATGASDPSSCNFAPGDSIVIRINMTAADNTNAYISNLGFAFSNN